MTPITTTARRRLGRALCAGAGAAAALLAVALATGDVEGPIGAVALPGVAAALLIGSAVQCALRAARTPDDRLTWWALCAAIVVWTTGDTVRAVFYSQVRPFPSVADVLYLGFYPCAGIAVIGLVRARLRQFHRSVLLDGAIAMCAVAALALAAVVPAARHAGDHETALLVNLVFPVADVALLGLIAGSLSLTGLRPAPDLARVGAGLAVFAISDAAYVLFAAQGQATVLWLGAGWVASMLILAWASGTAPPTERRVRPATRMFVVPLVSGALSIALLLAGTLVKLPIAGPVLAALALVLGVVRTAVSFRENVRLAESRRQAVTDELTGLANRRRLSERMGRAFADRAPDGGIGLLLIDLDRFKELNDTLGHHIGDLMLRRLGDRLVEALPKADVVARLGGDEFAVLLTGEVGAGALEAAAIRIQAVLDEPFALDGLELHVAGSVGGALVPGGARDAAELLQHADIAMYRAKRSGSDFEAYRADRDGRTRDRLELSEQLRHGIDAGELLLHFQPKGDLRSGRITGVEALVRWQHPVRGLLMPDAFIPLAEETGLMRPLTRAVLRGALTQAAAWRRDGHDLSVAVNLAMANVLDPLLPGEVRAELDAAGVPPQRLVLELTENIVMSDPERMLDVLAQLRELGVELSLDDFGTGHSSLAYLKRLPVQEVKLDRSFVRRMTADAQDAAVVRVATELGHALGLRVVAEGVEDGAVWRALRDAGCDLGQGYHLARPVPPGELASLLAPALADAA